jgi:hypothetical protein
VALINVKVQTFSCSITTVKRKILRSCEYFHRVDELTDDAFNALNEYEPLCTFSNGFNSNYDDYLVMPSGLPWKVSTVNRRQA